MVRRELRLTLPTSQYCTAAGVQAGGRWRLAAI